MAVLRFIEIKFQSKLFCGSRFDHLRQEIIIRKLLCITVSFQTMAVFLLHYKVKYGENLSSNDFCFEQTWFIKLALVMKPQSEI